MKITTAIFLATAITVPAISGAVYYSEPLNQHEVEVAVEKYSTILEDFLFTSSLKQEFIKPLPADYTTGQVFLEQYSEFTEYQGHLILDSGENTCKIQTVTFDTEIEVVRKVTWEDFDDVSIMNRSCADFFQGYAEHYDYNYSGITLTEKEIEKLNK